MARNGLPKWPTTMIIKHDKHGKISILFYHFNHSKCERSKQLEMAFPNNPQWLLNVRNMGKYTSYTYTLSPLSFSFKTGNYIAWSWASYIILLLFSVLTCTDNWAGLLKWILESLVFVGPSRKPKALIHLGPCKAPPSIITI